MFISVLNCEAPPSGSEDEEIVTAHVTWGPGKVGCFERKEGESTDAFAKRTDQFGQLSWPNAKQKYELRA